MMLKFHIDQLEVLASVGILPEEQRLRQPLLITCNGTIEPKRWPLQSLEDSVSYADIAEALRSITLSQHWDLLEELLEAQRSHLAETFPLVTEFNIRLEKPTIIASAQSVGLSLAWTRG